MLLNAAPAREMASGLLELIDVLIVNRVEASMLAGSEVSDRDTALAALARLSAPGRSVVVTLGGGGVVVQPDGEAPRWIAAKPVRVVSTHGAGDGFVGSLAARLAQGESLMAAAEHANAAAAALVSA